MLDSGGRQTQFTASTLPGLVGGQQRSSGRGVGGSEAFGSEVTGQRLRVGGAAIPLHSLHLVDAMEGRDGLVGMDLLRGTVLTVSGDATRPVLWQVS